MVYTGFSLSEASDIHGGHGRYSPQTRSTVCAFKGVVKLRFNNNWELS